MENASENSAEVSIALEPDHLVNLILTKDTMDASRSKDPAFLEALGEVTSGCLDNLSTTVDQLRFVQQRLNRQIEQLAAEHYPVFLAKAEASQTVLQKISDILSLNDQLVSRLPGLVDDSKGFLNKADKFGSALQMNSKALEKHTQVRFATDLVSFA